MALRLRDGSVFLHIPKTGGNWVAEVLVENDLADHYEGHTHAHFERHLYTGRHGSGQDLMKEAGRLLRMKVKGQNYIEETKQIFRFCFVRNPLDWWESWFFHKTDKHWNLNGTVNDPTDWHVCLPISGVSGETFHDFMRKILSHRPGFVSELYFSYVKPGISYVGQTEHLAQGLREVLDFHSTPYSEDSLQQKKPSNTSERPKENVEWDPELKKLTVLSELPAMIKFGYLTDEMIDEYNIPNAVRSAEQIMGFQDPVKERVQ